MKNVHNSRTDNASFFNFKRLEKRASEEARQREIEARIAQRVETEMVTPLRKEIALLEERVREETQAKRDEEIVRG